jgi:heterodisulfide reductase subunit A-like polyferredoxin
MKWVYWAGVPIWLWLSYELVSVLWGIDEKALAVFGGMAGINVALNLVNQGLKEGEKKRSLSIL